MKTFFDLNLIEIGNKGEILIFDTFNNEDLAKKINKNNFFLYIKSNKKNYLHINSFYNTKYFSNFLYDGIIWKSNILFLKNRFYKIVMHPKVEGIKYNFDFLIKDIENYNFWYKNYNSKDILKQIRLLFEKNIKFYTYTALIEKLSQLFYLYIEVASGGWFEQFTKIKLLIKQSNKNQELYDINKFKQFISKDDFEKFNDQIKKINYEFYENSKKKIKELINKYNFYHNIYQFIGIEYNKKFIYKKKEITFLEIREILIFSNKNIYFFYDKIFEYLKNAFDFIDQIIVKISKEIKIQLDYFKEKKFFNIVGSIKDQFIQLNKDFLLLIKDKQNNFYSIDNFYNLLWKLNNSYLKYFFIIAKKNYSKILADLKIWNHIHKKKAIFNILPSFKEALISFNEDKMKNFLKNNS